MKTKNNGLIIISFFVFLLSCKGKADYSISQEHVNDTTFAEKKEYILLNDSFYYEIARIYDRSENGLYYTAGFEIILDSSYTNYLKTLKSEYILKLLKSEESDLATYVALKKLYDEFPSPSLFDLDKNKAENWRKQVVKRRVIEYWKEELSEHNHDSLRLVYLESLNIQTVEGFPEFRFDSNAAKKSDKGNYLLVRSIDSGEQMNVTRDSKTGKYSKYGN